MCTQQHIDRSYIPRADKKETHKKKTLFGYTFIVLIGSKKKIIQKEKKATQKPGFRLLCNDKLSELITIKIISLRYSNCDNKETTPKNFDQNRLRESLI